MRDRLIELIEQGQRDYYNAYGKDETRLNKHLADYLLANGVMLSTNDPIQLMTLTVKKIVKNMEKYFEKIEHPFGKTIVAAIVKEVLIKAIEETQEAEVKLKEGKG